MRYVLYIILMSVGLMTTACGNTKEATRTLMHAVVNGACSVANGAVDTAFGPVDDVHQNVTIIINKVTGNAPKPPPTQPAPR